MYSHEYVRIYENVYIRIFIQFMYMYNLCEYTYNVCVYENVYVYVRIYENVREYISVHLYILTQIVCMFTYNVIYIVCGTLQIRLTRELPDSSRVRGTRLTGCSIVVVSLRTESNNRFITAKAVVRHMY